MVSWGSGLGGWVEVLGWGGGGEEVDGEGRGGEWYRNTCF